jgi:uncharacterized Zn finger protein (UPF0148 family)
MSKRCPHCEEEITFLDYGMDVRESGTWSEENGYETSDSEGNGDTNFYCPECGEEIVEDWERLENFEEESEEEESDTPQESENLRPLYLDPREAPWLTAASTRNYRQLDKFITANNFIRCECGQILRRTNGEKGLICPHCETEIEIKD